MSWEVHSSGDLVIDQTSDPGADNVFISVKAQPKRCYDDAEYDSDVWDMRFDKGLDVVGYINHNYTPFELVDDGSSWKFKDTATLKQGPSRPFDRPFGGRDGPENRPNENKDD